MPTQAITAVVVSCNEGHLLGRCLASLSFCNELLVIDLQSTDSSREVAAKHGAKIIVHERVNHAEAVLTKIRQFTDADWILLIDPDEVISAPLAEQLQNFLLRPDLNEIGQIKAPWQFYFGKKRLDGTVWGGDRFKDFIINLNGVEFTGLVHRGRRLLPSHRAEVIQWNAERTNVVDHYWMINFAQLLEKHRRYLLVEGEAMHKEGLTYSARQQWRETYVAFKECAIWKRGYKDGLTGIGLSLFWAWYVYKKWASLKTFVTRATLEQSPQQEGQRPPGA